MSHPAHRCPSCRAPVVEGAKSFPFCSERCRLVDLGNWLEERYVVPGTVEDDALSERSGDESLPPGPAGPLGPRRLH